MLICTKAFQPQRRGRSAASRATCARASCARATASRTPRRHRTPSPSPATPSSVTALRVERAVDTFGFKVETVFDRVFGACSSIAVVFTLSLLFLSAAPRHVRSNLQCVGIAGQGTSSSIARATWRLARATRQPGGCDAVTIHNFNFQHIFDEDP